MSQWHERDDGPCRPHAGPSEEIGPRLQFPNVHVFLNVRRCAENAGILLQELGPNGPETLRQRLTFQFIQQRLGIERVHLAGTALPEKEKKSLTWLWQLTAASSDLEG